MNAEQNRVRYVLMKPASGNCNMNCRYCFYRDEAEKRKIASYGMMSEETLENAIRKLLHQGKGSYTIAFQGGEPTLRGLDFYRKAVKFSEEYNASGSEVTFALQTNGYLLDENWCAFFKEHHFLVGISVDGTRATHDLFRVGQDDHGTYDRVRRSVDLLKAYDVDYNILTVVNRATAEHIREIYQEYRRNGWQYQQYITCLDPIGTEPGSLPYSLTPRAYGQFLIDLFGLWYKNWRQGREPYIRQFDNYIGILLGYEPESCEQRGVCSVQCVIEADGSVYPCDFYALDSYRLGNINTDRLPDLMSSPVGADFVKGSLQVSSRCRQCPYAVLCRDGCRRSRVRNEGEDGYTNYFCEGYRMFFDACGERLREVAQETAARERRSF
ncbi:MAG: anaerobic sulfatase maturase [Lachnospiraceae bacterium]